MPSIHDVANPEATKDAVVTVTNPNNEKFRIAITFYPNRVRRMTQSKKNGRNGHGDDTSLLHSLATASDVLSVDDDEDEEAFDPLERVRKQNEDSLLEAAAGFCDMYVKWDLSGPLLNGDDEIIVPEGEIIPLEAKYVRWVPLWLRGDINDGVQEILFPSLKELRGSRRR